MGTFGGIDIWCDGRFTYVVLPEDPDFIALREGQTAVERFEYTIFDDEGGTATGVLSITITGANDAPSVTSGGGAVTEDAPTTTTSGSIAIADIDNGDVEAIATVNGTAFSGASGTFSGTYGTLELSSTGNWVYTLDNSLPATEALGADQQVAETFAITVADTLGLTASGSIEITVTGADDAPMVPLVAARVFLDEPGTLSEDSGSVSIEGFARPEPAPNTFEGLRGADGNSLEIHEFLAGSAERSEIDLSAFLTPDYQDVSGDLALASAILPVALGTGALAIDSGMVWEPEILVDSVV